MNNEEILKNYYVSAEDIIKILPIGIVKANKIIKEIQEEMKEKKYFIPDGRKRVALTKLFKKRYGL